jgi:hypothetical protein
MSAEHPVGSSQQGVQVAALEAPHADTPASGAGKQKKEKAKAQAEAAYPLEV